MIRTFLSLAILFQYKSIFANSAPQQFHRYDIQWWTCNKPNRHPILMKNRIVMTNEKIILTSWQRSIELDETCASNDFAENFRIGSMAHFDGHTVASVHTSSFDYAFDFSSSGAESILSVTVRITSDTGYDLTCTTPVKAFQN